MGAGVGLQRELELGLELTYIIQKERNRHEQNGEKAKQAASPVDSKFIVHCRGEEGKAGSERRPHQVVARVYTCHVIGVTEGENQRESRKNWSEGIAYASPR